MNILSPSRLFGSHGILQNLRILRELGTLDHIHSNAQLRYMRQIALLQLFPVDMIVDIDGLMANIASKFLYEISRHSCPHKMSCEPVATAMRREPILKAF